MSLLGNERNENTYLGRSCGVFVRLIKHGTSCKFQVNSFFRETCSSDLIWEELFFRHNDDVSEELIDLAMERGWKEVFFANKLHLRVSNGGLLLNLLNTNQWVVRCQIGKL